MNCKCQEIAEKGKKDIENSLTIPFAAHESAMGRAERHIKSLVWVIVLLIVLLVGSNIAWIAYENSFDDMTETYTVEQDGAETNNSVINGGVIN